MPGGKTRRQSLVHIYERYEEQILAEQVEQLYRLAPLGMLATAMNSALVFFVMKDVVELRYLAPWLVTLSVVTLARGWLNCSYLRSDRAPAKARVWAKRFVTGLVAAGAAWGSIGALPFTGVSIAHQVFIAFVLGGMAAGATTTFATVRHAYLAYLVPALMPLALHFMLINDTFHYVMALMLALFGVLLWRIARHNYGVNRTSLLLRFENREVIETLEQAKERVERLNARLIGEIRARQKAEAGLRAQREELEKQVDERTADLRASNARLKNEIEGRKQYEEALLETGKRLATAQKNAEAASKAKTEFLANMSHEMRTPLAGALGMITLVLTMDVGAEERRLLEMAKRSADSLLRIISDVLDFSRVEAGVLTLERKAFALQAVVRSAVEVVSLVAEEKKLRLVWEIDPRLPERIEGDEGRVRQVLVNLLGNAVKFTEHGEIAVAVTPVTGDEEEMMLFSVRDTGIGIPQQQIERIFGRFTQVDSSLTRSRGGTGLGLALTRQIVERLGGRIWAESREGSGSTFYFTLPIAPGAETESGRA